MHPLRRRVLEMAVANEGQMTTVTFAARLDLPHTSLRRHLEDLGARGVLCRVAHTGPEAWVASDWTRAHWRSGCRP
jgi:predicted ArsR family transcriptional regulator